MIKTQNNFRKLLKLVQIQSKIKKHNILVESIDCKRDCLQFQSIAWSPNLKVFSILSNKIK
jgi:hypothetical protein